MNSTQRGLSSSQNESIELETRVRGKLRKSGNVKSKDSDRSGEDVKSFKAVDVVVDVHRESERKGSSSQEVEETIVEVLTEKTTNLTNKKTQEDRPNRDKARPRSVAPTKRPTIDDSVDLIEEFHDTDARYERRSLVSLGDESPSEEAIQQVPRRRKQWNTSHEIEDVRKKPPRKRWSKNASVFHLPETAGSISSAASPNHESVPVPAPKPALKQNSFFGFDNAAFASDNDSEDVLRIETNYNDKETMRIEMKSIKNMTGEELSEDQMNDDQPEVESLQIEEQEQLSSKIFGNSIQTIEMSDDSDANDRSSSGKMALISSRRRSVASDPRKGRAGKREAKSDSSLSRQDSRGELSEPETSVFGRRSSKDTTLSTNEDSNENLHNRSCSEHESMLMSSSRKTSKFDGERVHSEKKPRRKAKRIEEVEEIRSRNKRRKKKKTKDGKEVKEARKELKYISITIHKADMLETDYITKHPMVKVHIVEADTGNYLKNTVNEGSSYLQPVITGKFDFKLNKSMMPVWEEELIFEHDFDAIERADDKRVVVLFEVVDLLSFSEASCNYDRFGNEGCWYKIAWAFLKPIGVNNTTHTKKMVRLQLYRPRRNLKKFARHKCEAYTWWRSNIRDKYPSSLFVTVTSVEPPKLEPVLYQQLSFVDLSESVLSRNESQRISTTRTSDSISLPKWTRLAAQSCKIPNDKLFETEVSENGCFFVAFSKNGKFLACVNSEEYDYPIVVYEMTTQKMNVQFKGHKTFVYSVDWCSDDRSLLSVSSDQTARIWDVRNRMIEHIQLLPHPSYVYCGRFDPRDASIVATGCYDRVVRIWSKQKRSTSYELGQELEGHEGFVNTMCFQKEGNLLTADSVGLIIVWAAKKNRKAPSKKEWQISRKIKVREMEGVTINTIALHPLESRVLAHSRNNGLRMLDLATGVVLQKYKGLNNQRIQSIACISPCGGLIFCGGEDSSLNVWSFDTGKYLARYTIERKYRAVTCVDYHPYDHVLAFSTFGSPAPVRLLRFDTDSTGEEVGLKLFTEQNNASYRSDVAVSMLKDNMEFGETSRFDSIGKREDMPSKRDSTFPLARSLRLNQTILSNPEGERHRQDFRLKVDRRLNETERGTKSNSTSRLYHIIEKIDRILSNTSRSSDDIESGRNVGFEMKDRRVEDDIVARKSDQSRQADELNLSDDSKIESLRMSKLVIEDEVSVKGRSRSVKTRRSGEMLESYNNSENETIISKKKPAKSVSEQSSDGTTYSTESKTPRDTQRSKANFRKKSAHSDRSRDRYNGEAFELVARRRNSKSDDDVRFTDFGNKLKMEKKRSKSAKGWRSERLDETVSNAFSDSAANSRRRRRFHESENDSTPNRKAKSMPGQSSDGTSNSIEKRKLRKVKKMDNLTLQHNLVSESSRRRAQSGDFARSPEARRKDSARKQDSTSDSGGTYVLEKADLETNEDFNLTKMLTSETSSSNEKKKNLVGSEASLNSNATFVLEHERVPIPKPRKKKPS